MYLLDTNTVIYFFKNKGDVASHLLSTDPKEVFIPSIVLYELEVGIAKSTAPRKRKEQLRLLIEQVSVIDFTYKEAQAAALIRSSLEAKGTPIGPMDTLIAACALANDLILVTHNTKEFQRIENLQIKDWF